MITKITKTLLLFTILISFTSCSVIGGIFKAGMGVGIIIVVAIVAIILFVISKISGKK
ncbi:hypothetical protein [Flavobacterium sp. WC2430]|uniref:hypothetical protein n=1 Tax=Flavobacterium sp. WC2430 TaxID=3234137 RepID=UPI00346592E6